MRIKTKVTLIIFLTMLTGIALFACNREVFSVTYIASEGGIIEGKASQTVYLGKDAASVTAIPDEGYGFARWSDNGRTNPIRQDNNVISDITATAIFSKEFSVIYTTDGSGYIEGEATQKVLRGNSAVAVTAIPNEGYRFVKWSDTNSSNPARTSTYVTSNINATAIFEKIVNIYIYNYNNATGNNSVENIEIAYESLGQSSFIVPQREYFTFDGWYLDKEFITQVSNSFGNITIGYEIFDNASSNLYAKWIVIEQYKQTYKSLLVFITELHADLEDDDGIIRRVDYSMSEIERQICELIGVQMSRYLNEWFAGLVEFEFDTYFTTVSLDELSFLKQTKGDYRIFANQIPEVKDILSNYKSVLTGLNLQDYPKYKLHKYSGMATEKYATIYLDSIFGMCTWASHPLDMLLDLNDLEWLLMLDTFIHEFTHTIETCYEYFDIYSYHEALISRGLYPAILQWPTRYETLAECLEVTKLYLLNQFPYGNELGGIPYSWWDNKIRIMLYDNNFDNNDISVPPYYGEPIPYEVEYGSNLIEIVKNISYVPVRKGYKFVGWSRQHYELLVYDYKIEYSIMLFAIWEPI